jgi:WD40 repeat protein
MPDIPLVNQAFDLVFHPTSPTVYVGLLTGEIKAFSYTADAPESEFRYTPVYTIRPTKRSCRGLTTNLDGTKLFSVSKDKTLHVIDTMTGKVLDARLGAHERVKDTLSIKVSSAD